MTRRLLPRHRIGLAIALLLPMIGCGGTSSVSVGVPTDNNGPPVTGLVSMPNGQLAQLPSALERLAQVVVARVEALVSGSVRPVGAGVEVRLVRIGPENIVNGEITHGSEAVLLRTSTLDGGGYSNLRLKTNTNFETCRYMLEVGSASSRTLTRAFVYGGTIDVDFESEATVRLILDQIATGQTSLCALTADDIRLIHDSVVASDRVVFGSTAASVNSAALVAAASDPAVQDAIAQAVGLPTPPPATETAAPEPSATGPPPTATTPQATNTAAPTRTHTTRPSATASRPPTRTDTPQPTGTTALPTATVPPPTNTPSPTNTTSPTNTPAPTNTVPPNTATPSATNTTAVPTASVTRTSTATVQATSTATPTATQPLPRVDLGSVLATAGQTVELPVSLVTNGATIAAVSNDIEYDPTRLDVAAGANGPDCTVDSRLAGTKSVVARVTTVSGGRKRLRVGVVGTTNNQSMTSGALYTCRFAIDSSASGAQALLNAPEAANREAVAVEVAGNAGTINVTAAPAALDLSAGTAAAGGTVAITATLNGRGQPLAAVATDIHFDPDRVTVADADQNGAPDCAIDAGVAGLGKELVAVQVAPLVGDDAVLRVGIVGRTNATALPDTGALFTCTFIVQSAGGTIALPHNAEGASPAAQPVGLQAGPGSIAVP